MLDASRLIDTRLKGLSGFWNQEEGFGCSVCGSLGMCCRMLLGLVSRYAVGAWAVRMSGGDFNFRTECEGSARLPRG